TFRDLIGEHPAFVRCLQKARQAAFSGMSTLIVGESGTGKELFAHAIHHHGDRSEAPFLRVNCPAIPATLLESELFGYEKGAFTGAIKDKEGKFELAQGGSIFLDEIGDMDITLQSKLLRVLQEREVERLGSNHVVPVDVRVIAATNQDLGERIQKGLFRKDLYYRLEAICIEIPPLRTRRSDIPILVEHFMKEGMAGRPPCYLSKEGMEMFTDYDWPGNVRELKNTVERLLLCAEGQTVGREEVLLALEGRRGESAPSAGLTLAAIEAQAIRRSLECHGRSLSGKKRAAGELGISLSCLYDKIRKY
ncbi:MAG: sigma 54-interacting transcriptional regulator, partial [Pseudoflavonifractor sp.]